MFAIDLKSGRNYLFVGDFSSGSTIVSGDTYSEVNLYSDLPDPSLHGGDIYIVRSGSGNYIADRKSSGLYFSNGTTWSYLGETPTYFKSNNFQVYDSSDITKGLKFVTSGITTNNFRKLTIQNSDGTLAYLSDVNVKLNSTIFNTYTGTTVPNTYLRINTFSGYTGTTAPNTFLKLNQSSPQTISGRPIFNDGLMLGTNPTIGGFEEGKLFYDKNLKTISAMIDSDVTLQIGQESVQLVYNDTGIDIPNGSVVYVTGATGDYSKVALARADSMLASNIEGIATQTIPSTGDKLGLITVRGLVHNLNTSGYTNGDILYLSPTVSGGVTNIKPTATNHQVVIVGRAHEIDSVNGSIYVQPVLNTTNLNLKQNVFNGFDETTPITVSINYTSRVLTVSPVGASFNFYVGGTIPTIYRKVGSVNFPAFTNTSGTWYFYFDKNGNAITTQTFWGESTYDYVPVYRLVWNSTKTPDASKSISEFIEYHPNTIPLDDVIWKNSFGAIWLSGFTITHNALVTGAPNVNGSNTVIGLSSGENLDSNLSYNIVNSTSIANWNQDLGDNSTTTITSGNSGIFNVRYKGITGSSELTTGTRFPFLWNSGNNRPEYINISGIRTVVTDNNYFVYFVYAIQDQRNKQAVRITPSYGEYTTIDEARSITWLNVQTQDIAAADSEIRVLYRLIFHTKYLGGQAYSANVKYSVLREVLDLRKSIITQTSIVGGTIPATNVSFVPSGNISSTNVQSAISELDLEKLSVTSFNTPSWTPTSIHNILTNSGVTSSMLTSMIIRISGNTAPTIVSATPSIAAGNNGQIIILKGSSNTNTVTLQSEVNLAGSKLKLDGGVNFTMGLGDILQLYYDSVDGFWYEISRKNNM